MTDRGRSGTENGEPTRDRGQPAADAATLSRRVPADIRDVSFRTSLHGYERREVDRYVQRVNQAIAELEIARSPESAVRHALDRVGEQTSGILREARDSADAIIGTARTEADGVIERGAAEGRKILADARSEADATLAAAGAEAHKRVEQGERELAAARSEIERLRSHVAAIADQRHRLVEEIHELAARLEAVADSGDATGTPTPAADAVAEAHRRADA
jgi:DivIVA domain-containing protein